MDNSKDGREVPCDTSSHDLQSSSSANLVNQIWVIGGPLGSEMEKGWWGWKSADDRQLPSLLVWPLEALGGGGGFCTACTRRLKTHTLLVGEGTCLVWHIYALGSRLQTEKLPNMASSYLTWRHPVLWSVACTQCPRGATWAGAHKRTALDQKPEIRREGGREGGRDPSLLPRPLPSARRWQ